MRRHGLVVVLALDRLLDPVRDLERVVVSLGRLAGVARGRFPHTPRQGGRSRSRWGARCRSRGTGAGRGRPFSVSGSRSSSTRQLPAVDEQRHEAGRLLEHRRHLGRDAELCGCLVRDALRRAVDPQDRGALSGQADDVVGPAEVHAEVTVRDPALELNDAALARSEQRGDASDHLGELGDRDLLVHGRTLRPRRASCEAPCPDVGRRADPCRGGAARCGNRGIPRCLADPPARPAAVPRPRDGDRVGGDRLDRLRHRLRGLRARPHDRHRRARADPVRGRPHRRLRRDPAGAPSLARAGDPRDARHLRALRLRRVVAVRLLDARGACCSARSSRPPTARRSSRSCASRRCAAGWRGRSRARPASTIRSRSCS